MLGQVQLIFLFILILMTVDSIFGAGSKDPGNDVVVATTERSWWSTLRDKDTWPLVVSGSLAAVFVVGSLVGGFFYLYYANYYYNQKKGDERPVINKYYPYRWRMLDGGEDRAMGQGGSPTFAAILEMIAVAKELHEHFDRPQCFTKHFCEVQEEWPEFTEFRNKVSGAYSFLFSKRFMNIVEKLPLPTLTLAKIRNSLGTSREAFMQGRYSGDDGGCAAIFPQCPSSYKEIMVRFMRKITNRFNEVAARRRGQQKKHL